MVTTQGTKVSADRDRCVGSGLCVLTEPAVFDQHDDDGTVRLVTDEPGPDVADGVRKAVATCPSRALTVSGD
jgi:ferredoxin